MPVTAPHENMDIDGDDNNIEEASTSKAVSSFASTSSNSAKPAPNDAMVSNVMASPSIIPSVTVSLHPLVIMNISEHWTRIRAQEGSPSQGRIRHHCTEITFNICSSCFLFPLLVRTVIGALIGKQTGRNIEVMNSFELKFQYVEEDINIRLDYYHTKEEQCKSGNYLPIFERKKESQFTRIANSDKQVFKDLDFLGWYSTGNQPDEQDIKIHKQICEINECPIFLQLSPQARNFDVSKSSK